MLMFSSNPIPSYLSKNSSSAFLVIFLHPSFIERIYPPFIRAYTSFQFTFRSFATLFIVYHNSPFMSSALLSIFFTFKRFVNHSNPHLVFSICRKVGNRILLAKIVLIHEILPFEYPKIYRYNRRIKT